MNIYNIFLKFLNIYMCLKLLIAIIGQFVGVFWMCRRGCLNLLQLVCKKFIVFLKELEFGEVDENFFDCVFIRQ